MAKRIQGITIELDGETRPLQKALADVDKRSRDLQKELRDVERLLKFDPSNTEALAQKQQLLAEQVQATTERLNRLRAAQQQVEQQFKSGEIGAEQYRAFRREIQYTEARLNKFKQQLAALDDGKSLDNVKKDLKGVSKEANEAQNSVSELGSAIGGLAAGGGIAGAVSQALDTAGLQTKIEISMEVPPESVEAVKKAVHTVTAYIGDQEAALEGVRRQWALNADASDEANARIVKGAAAISKAYAGIDFVELIQEVNEIADALKISNEDALALTNSLLKMNFPPEQLDIISEYGLQLRMAGYEAEEIQAIFAAGIDTKTWNIDNLLDGLKEGRIRLSEFGEEVPKAVQDLLEGTDISAKQMQEWGRAVAQGGEAGKKAMVEVAQAIKNVDDETTKYALGVATFGTMYEDQGEKILDTLINAKGEVVSLTENQRQLNEQIQATDEDPIVQLKQALAELKEALEPLLIPIANFISKLAEWIKQNPELAATIMAIVTAIGILMGIFLALAPIITAIAGLATALGVSFGAVAAPVLIVIGVIAALIAIGIALWKNWDTIKAKALEIWESIKNWLRDKWEQIKSYARDKWEQMKQHIADKLEQAKERIESIWNRVENFFENIDLVQTGKDIIQGLIDGIVSLKDRVLQKAKEIAEGIKDRIADVLWIFSPSRVMEEMGEYIGEGLAIGIENSVDRVRRATDSITRTVTRSTGGLMEVVRKYLQAVEEDGDWLNDWLTHMPRKVADPLKKYFQAIEEDGDWLNDWITHLPANIQDLVKRVGRSVSPWLEGGGDPPRASSGPAIAKAPVEINVALDGQQIMPTIRRELTFDLDAALKGVR